MANHPHNPDRPNPKGVKKALERDDMKALALALSPRQRGFAHEYIVDFNGTAAAIRAGYSPRTAMQQAAVLQKHAGVARYIDHLTMSKEARVTSVTPDYVIQGILAIVNKESARDGDKLRGFELIAKHLGMFIDRTEISGPAGQAIEIQKTQEEAADFVRNLKNLGDRSDEKAELGRSEAKKVIELV